MPRLAARLAVLALVALAPCAALAAPPRVTLGATPELLDAGTALRLTLRVSPASAPRPRLTVTGPAGRVLRPALTVAGAGRYGARVTLAAGRWTVAAQLAGRAARLRVLHVATAPALAGGTRLARTCRSDAIPFQQDALAVLDGAAWLACRGDGTVVRIDAAGRVTARVAVPLQPWAVAVGEGGVWVIDRDRPVAVRLDPVRGTVVARISLPDAPVAVWAGAGSAWFALDGHGSVARVDPATNAVTAEIATGDGPAGFASDGRRVFVANHRARSVSVIDPGADQARTLVTGLGPPESATERLALAGGSLWVTGRGLQLLRLDPADGRLQAELAIGPAGIGVVAGDHVWVAVATPTGARRGDPDVGALLEVDPASGAVVARHEATAVSLGGLAAAGGRAWVADARHGALLAAAGG